MNKKELVIVALSGGVDSATSAFLLKKEGYEVEALHMTNWEDDKYCESAQDYKDAKKVCNQLDIALHRVNFSDSYKKTVFKNFLSEYRNGRTPNPDILCNKNIKFGVLQKYIKRLGGKYLATGHYANIITDNSKVLLLKGKDRSKDQTYFLHAVDAKEFANVIFPLGNKYKSEVREIAKSIGLHIAKKKDSTGICFIGERPFTEFLSNYIDKKPGDIKDIHGQVLGSHIGLPYYTLGQRQGLGIGGTSKNDERPWYVVKKDQINNEIIVAQGKDHPLLFKKKLLTKPNCHWINGMPLELKENGFFICNAKIRYRQDDQLCKLTILSNSSIKVEFEKPQRSITPGQYIVFYKNEYCLGGAIIDKISDLD
ncbi:MAG: tRNA 2-thiouridine(34) synthase MnmA [Gammaproteobacteria bacterium TMED78]|nr:MAG: tRNA 2-thiouridine(34) synthase MnmA [Gammaproteobacteria bacterium TMED78]|tara:strand:- start:56475 stop:57578 length:1104 start_codon:yes stop_codon:yes gene_type:complete